MAQSISNLTTSSNPMAGLLGLAPKPKATVNTTTPQSGVGAPQTNFQSLLGKAAGGINAATSFIPNAVGGIVKGELGALGSAYNYLKSPAGAPAPVATPNPTGTPSFPTSNPVTQPVVTPSPVKNSGVTTTGGSTGGNSGVITTPSGMPVTGNPGTFGGVAQTTPTTTRGLFPDVVSSLAASGTANNALGANAQKIAEDYGARIADVGGQGARFEAGQRTTGTTPVAEGNAAVTAQSTAAEQAALAAGESAALTGNAQAITAQGQTQSALTAAGGLASPQLTTPGQAAYDPTTNTFSGGITPDVMQQYAQMAVSGQYSTIPSFITSNPVLNAQLNVAAKTLNPNYSPVSAQGASGVLAGIPAMQSANVAADGIKNTIQTYLTQNPQLNPSDLVAGNKLAQWVQSGQIGDPKYQTLGAQLSEYVSTLAPVLGVGGDTTNLKTQIAQGMVNAAASGKSISEVLDNISSLANNKIIDLQSGALGGGTSVPNSSVPTGAGLYSF